MGYLGFSFLKLGFPFLTVCIIMAIIMGTVIGVSIINGLARKAHAHCRDGMTIYLKNKTIVTTVIIVAFFFLVLFAALLIAV